MPVPQRRPPFDWFNYGRQEAGMGWYQPGPSAWLSIAAPALQGAMKGAVQGYGIYKAQSLTDQLNATGPGNPTTGAVVGSQDMPPDAPGGFTGGADILRSRPETYPDPMGEAMGGIGVAPYSPSVPAGAGANPALGYTGGAPTPQQRQDMTRQLMMLRLMGIYSSRALKDDITRADERRSLREVMQTPVYTYRYHDEATPERIGPMAEEVPARWQIRIGETAGIRMPVMLGALHAATRALARDVRSLKDRAPWLTGIRASRRAATGRCSIRPRGSPTS